MVIEHEKLFKSAAKAIAEIFTRTRNPLIPNCAANHALAQTGFVHDLKARSIVVDPQLPVAHVSLHKKTVRRNSFWNEVPTCASPQPDAVILLGKCGPAPLLVAAPYSQPPPSNTRHLHFVKVKGHG